MSSLKHAGMGYSTRGSVSEAAQATCTGTGGHDHCATRPPHPRTARWPPPHHVEVHFLDSARDGVAHHQLPPPSALRQRPQTPRGRERGRAAGGPGSRSVRTPPGSSHLGGRTSRDPRPFGVPPRPDVSQLPPQSRLSEDPRSHQPAKMPKP
ncbi:hypothetical protein U0070_015015, partial [Myodes glareolus]